MNGVTQMVLDWSVSKDYDGLLKQKAHNSGIKGDGIRTKVRFCWG